MEYIELFAGFVLIVVFAWILVRNSKRTGWQSAVLTLDNVLIIIAGICLVIFSTRSLFF